MLSRFFTKDPGKEAASPHPAVEAVARLLEISADAAEAGRLQGHRETSERLRRLARGLRGADASGDPFGGRDSKEVLDLFHKVRSMELQGFQSAIKETRDLVWNLVHRLSSTLGEAREDSDVLERQVGRLQKAVQSGSLEALKEAAQDTATALTRTLQERRKRNDSQHKALSRELENLHAQLEHLKHEVNVDGLTRVHNRRALDDHLPHVTSLCTLLGDKAAVCLFDIDKFKSVNDGHGHAVGDEVLRATGKLLLEHFPRRTDFVARYGGEEFCVVLLDEGVDGTLRRARRFSEALKEHPIAVEGGELRVTISGGIAPWRDGEDAAAWLARADATLYAAKEAGRDRVLVEKPPSAS